MSIQIIGFGKYLPQNKLGNAFFATHFQETEETIFSKTGVRARHKADLQAGETTEKMGAIAIGRACERAGIRPEELDLIINVSAVPSQAIPDTSMLIQKELGLGSSGISCFSLHATCLGFLRGIEVLTGLFRLPQYKNAVIVSAELSSIGLNPTDIHTYPLFGDGAVAFVFTKNQSRSLPRMAFQGFGDYSSSATVKGGGSSISPKIASTEDYLFEMRGSQLLKYSLRHATRFLCEIFPEGLEKTEIDWVIPHQPSGIGLRAMARFFPPEKMITTLEEYGNCISASLPLSLLKGIELGKIQKGDQLLLIGTGAGLSLGAILLRY